MKSLKKKKLNVKLFDPYFTKDEIKKAVNVETFEFPNHLTKTGWVQARTPVDDLIAARKYPSPPRGR